MQLRPSLLKTAGKPHLSFACIGFMVVLAMMMPLETLHAQGQQSVANEKEKLIAVPTPALTPKEVAGLILMREEEKLARDVYRVLGKQWGIRIFENITKSEQTHMNAIKTRLDRYKLKDPIANDETGVFTSPKLTQLYGKLIKQGSASAIEAMKVGATIEDLDIKDLNELLKETDNPDITNIYENLRRGSTNHLRTFMRQIKNYNVSYTPQFISQAEFDSILTSSNEAGGGQGGQGKGRRYRGGRNQ
jgi:hypothetical protein